MDSEQVLLNLYKKQQYNETRKKMHKIFMLIAALASFLALIITLVYYTSWKYEFAFSSMIVCVMITALLIRFKVLQIETASYVSMLYACFVFVPMLWMESGMVGNTPFIAIIILVAVLSLFTGKKLHWMLGGYLVVLSILLTYSIIIELPTAYNIINMIYIISSYSVALALIVIYMFSKQREFDDLNDRFLRSSFKDELTQLYNRKLMDIIIDYQETEFRQKKNDYVLIMFDVDDFKQMNDERGHVYGDVVLRSIASCILETTRDSDFVLRYGGDEFLVIQPNATQSTVQAFTDRIEQRLATSCELDTKVGVSYGYASRFTCHSPGDALKLADQRLYENKQARKAGR